MLRSYIHSLFVKESARNYTNNEKYKDERRTTTRTSLRKSGGKMMRKHVKNKMVG